MKRPMFEHPRWHRWVYCLFGHGRTLLGHCWDCGRKVA